MILDITITYWNLGWVSIILIAGFGLIVWKLFVYKKRWTEKILELSVHKDAINHYQKGYLDTGNFKSLLNWKKEIEKEEPISKLIAIGLARRYSPSALEILKNGGDEITNELQSYNDHLLDVKDEISGAEGWIKGKNRDQIREVLNLWSVDFKLRYVSLFGDRDADLIKQIIERFPQRTSKLSLLAQWKLFKGFSAEINRGFVSQVLGKAQTDDQLRGFLNSKMAERIHDDLVKGAELFVNIQEREIAERLCSEISRWSGEGFNDSLKTHFNEYSERELESRFGKVRA